MRYSEGNAPAEVNQAPQARHRSASGDSASLVPFAALPDPACYAAHPSG